ncbi:MAG: OmpA family protein [Candidatus Adiutrix sp.]
MYCVKLFLGLFLLIFSYPAPGWGDMEEQSHLADELLGESAPLNQDDFRFEQLIAQRDGVEFTHQGRNYVWQNGVPFEKAPDGSLIVVKPPEDFYELRPDGEKWLSLEADGNIYINVAPKIWASINFAHNSAEIMENSKAVLDVFGSSLNSSGLLRHRLIIAGHTNNLGASSYNLTLSQKRAQSVSYYLIEHHHIDPQRLILHGYGDNRPLADNGTEEGLALNRRVEFILLSPPSP